MTTRDEILQAIRFQAAQNGGVALGQAKFAAATGIAVHVWRGKYWAFWNDAVAEAGLAPNTWIERIHDGQDLVRRLADLTLELGHYPATGERGMKRQADRTFPRVEAFATYLGGRKAQIKLLMEFAVSDPAYTAVYDMCAPLLDESAEVEPLPLSLASVPGKVYLIYSHNLGFYKIGESSDVRRRMSEIRASVPGQLDEVHVLETDDPAGIEQYWHRRFRDKKQINEWFKLTDSDVEAFKRRGPSM